MSDGTPAAASAEAFVERSVRELVERIAPGSGALTVGVEQDLRRELDLDSMDMLELAVALQRRFGVAVPPSDHGAIATLARCVALVTRARPTG